MNLNNNKVAINFIKSKSYPNTIPFDPSEKFPEYLGSSINSDNDVYAGVREVLYKLDLDKKNFNTAHWNPFKEIIKPGMTVFIKPNTVRHYHTGGGDVLSVIVHASILRPILDYVCIALKNKGKIIIGDSQVIFGHFDKAWDKALITQLLSWYKRQTSIPIEFFDLRLVRGVRSWLFGKWGRKKIEQDPLGYTFVDLGDLSCFKDIDPKRLRIAIASHKNMYKHHSGGKHEYLIPNSFLQSDVIINIAKFKTHRRTAVTLTQKNLFGIPAWKDTLPHFITGSPEEGGDQYINPSLRKHITTKLHDHIQSNPYTVVKFCIAVTKRLLWDTHKIVPFKDDVYEAMWHGNDTLWRTMIDLNRIVFYADKSGKIQNTPQRNQFCLIDGIISGEKDGPVAPDPVHIGLLMAGFNAVVLDAVGATLMGFNIDKIPCIKHAFTTNSQPSPLFYGSRDEIEIVDNEKKYSINELIHHRNLNFEPHPAWKGHVEL
jgi:uncharacterized protein (DUF362 family)